MEFLILIFVFPIAILANNNVSGIISVGDSYVDNGNNNYILTLNPIARANQLPYGRLFQGGKPTGRFTDGPLISDIIAQDLGLPFAPAYLDPNATGENLLHGANCASAGSSLLVSSSRLIMSATLQVQLSWLRDYRRKLITLLGDTEADEFLHNALYFFSGGTIDYYFKLLNPFEIATDTTTFRQKLIQSFRNVTKEMYLIGARKFVIFNLPPLGCLPTVITVYGNQLDLTRPCVEAFNTQAFDFNVALNNTISILETELPDVKFVVLDTYSIVLDMVKNPTEYGYKVTNRGCCGTGLLEFGALCNEAVGACKNGSEYVFFDVFHGTNSTYTVLAAHLRKQIELVLNLDS